MLGQTDNSAPYIYIQADPFKPEAIRLSFDSELIFNQWLQAVQKGRKEQTVARPTSIMSIGKRDTSIVTEIEQDTIVE